jgi:hypothetical protein
MWLYQGKEFTSEMIGDNYSFVYLITNNINGKMYIGKKVFKSKRTLPPLAGKKRRRIVIKESDWQRYWSSSKIVAEEIKVHGKENFTREIISIHPDKREANYAELAEQVIRNVLEARDESGERIYYNENIDRIYYPSKSYGEQRIVEHEARIQNQKVL